MLDILEQARRELVPGNTGREIFRAHGRPDRRGGPGAPSSLTTRPRPRPDVVRGPSPDSGDDTPLENWMVIAVEPGAYLAGRFGARVENVFVVTPRGGSRAPRREWGLRGCHTERLHHTGFTVSDLDRSVAFYGICSGSTS